MKEIALILLVYVVIDIGSLVFLLIPNGFFVTVLFIFNFIFILVKLRSREAIHQLRIKEAL